MISFTYVGFWYLCKIDSVSDLVNILAPQKFPWATSTKQCGITLTTSPNYTAELLTMAGFSAADSPIATAASCSGSCAAAAGVAAAAAAGGFPPAALMAFIEDITVMAVRASWGPFGGPVAAAAGAVAAGGGAKGRKSAAVLVRVSRGRWAGVLGGRREGRSRPGLEGGRILGGSIMRRNSLQEVSRVLKLLLQLFIIPKGRSYTTWLLGFLTETYLQQSVTTIETKIHPSHSVASHNHRIVFDIF